jgi:threonine aldolase
MDGARLSNAAAYLNCSLKEITNDCFVDILSFGGTKNGMVMGESVVVFNKDLANNLLYIRKQGMQLSSKMRFLSAQFVAFFENNLWLKNATHANKMAKYLAQQVDNIKGVNILFPVESNGVFARVSPEIIEKLQKKYFFYVWNEEFSDVRWMTSFNTTKEEVDEFVADLKQISKETESK